MGDSSLIDDVADDTVDDLVVFVVLENVEIFLDTGDGFVATSGSAQANFVVNNTRIQSAFICFYSFVFIVIDSKNQNQIHQKSQKGGWRV